MRRNRGLCVLVMAVFMFLTGCGSPSQAPTGRETGKETTGKTEQIVAQQEEKTEEAKTGVDTKAPAAEGDKWGTGLKAGFAACHYTNDWNITNCETVCEDLRSVGFEVVWNEANNDTATQIANVEDLLAQGIDLLVIKPKEEEGLIPALEACRDAGVPVICLDRKVSDPSLYVTAIMTDNVAGGETVGQWLVDHSPDGCKIVEIVGTAGSTGQIERSKGLSNVIDKYDQIQIISSQVGDNMRSEAQTVTENMIQAYGKEGIDVIVTQNDEMAMGCLQALWGLGIEPGQEITICTIGDGNSEVVEQVKDGTVGCVYESTPYLGPQVLEVAHKIFVTKEDVEKYIPSANRFFTIENADQELPTITW